MRIEFLVWSLGYMVSVFLVIFSLVNSAKAETVYTWVDESGVTHFSGIAPKTAPYQIYLVGKPVIEYRDTSTGSVDNNATRPTMAKAKKRTKNKRTKKAVASTLISTRTMSTGCRWLHKRLTNIDKDLALQRKLGRANASAERRLKRLLIERKKRNDEYQSDNCES